MSLLQKEIGTAFGRGFAGVDANGILAKFKTWVVKSAATGGPAWFILDATHEGDTNPYIVICDIPSPGLNDYNTGRTGGAPKILKVGYEAATAATINIDYYAGWNGTDPLLHLVRGIATTVDAGSFAYQFKGGDKMMLISTKNLDTYGIMEFTLNLDFQESAYNWGVLQNDMVYTGTPFIYTIVLGAGQGAGFVVGKEYYIVGTANQADYGVIAVKVNNIATDTLTVQELSTSSSPATITDGYVKAGSVLCSYQHRVWMISTSYRRLPYYKHKERYYNEEPVGFFGSAFVSGDLSPLTLSKSTAQQCPLVGYGLTFSNGPLPPEILGVVDDAYLVANTGMTLFQNGKIINTKPYLYSSTFDLTNSEAFIILDESSLS